MVETTRGIADNLTAGAMKIKPAFDRANRRCGYFNVTHGYAP